MRIRTITHLGHKDKLLLSMIKKHSRSQQLNQQINMLGSSAFSEGTSLHPSNVFRTKTMSVRHLLWLHTGTSSKPRAPLLFHHS